MSYLKTSRPEPSTILTRSYRVSRNSTRTTPTMRGSKMPVLSQHDEKLHIVMYISRPGRTGDFHTKPKLYTEDEL